MDAASTQTANPRKLFVGNISWNLRTEDLKELGSQYGTVEDAIVMTDKFTGRSKGFGFLTFSTEEEAQKAIEGMNNMEVDGRALVVNVAQPPRPREDRGFGGGRSGGGGYGGGGGGRSGGGGYGGGRGGGDRGGYRSRD